MSAAAGTSRAGETRAEIPHCRLSPSVLAGDVCLVLLMGMSPSSPVPIPDTGNPMPGTSSH